MSQIHALMLKIISFHTRFLYYQRNTNVIGLSYYYREEYNQSLS